MTIEPCDAGVADGVPSGVARNRLRFPTCEGSLFSRSCDSRLSDPHAVPPKPASGHGWDVGGPLAGSRQAEGQLSGRATRGGVGPDGMLLYGIVDISPKARRRCDPGLYRLRLREVHGQWSLLLLAVPDIRQ